jgi:hypothetical protein
MTSKLSFVSLGISALLMLGVLTIMTTTQAYGVVQGQYKCEENPNCHENRGPAAWCAVAQAENLGPGQGYGGLTIPELAPGAKGTGPCSYLN